MKPGKDEMTVPVRNNQTIIDAKNDLIRILERELDSSRKEIDLLKRENFQLRTRLDNYRYAVGAKRFYSPDDLAGILNVSKPTIMSYMKKGLLKHTVIVDPDGQRKTYRISESAFYDFIGESAPEKIL